MLPNSKELEKKLDPRVQRTRRQILQAFSNLMAEKRFESISIQDIADQAQINRVTFYAHFPDKYALLEHVVSYRFEQEIEKRTSNASSYTPENLRNLILAVCDFLSRMEMECVQPRQHFDTFAEGTIQKKLFEILSYWLKQSKPKASVELPATVATWAIYGLAVFYSDQKKHPMLETFVDSALPLVANNLKEFS